MSVGRFIKRVGRRFGLTIFRELPRGVDLFHDLRLCFPGHSFETLFDVGANVGQSARAMAAAFPGARIFSFEPASDTFELLKRNVAALPHVNCHRLALGETPGYGSLRRTANLTTRYLQDTESRDEAASAEEVAISSLDRFCEEVHVSRIDLLKIDTEGFDLRVLRGAARLLDQQAIAVIQCETGLDPDNAFHSSFDDVRAELYPRGYRLFGLYHQKPRETQALRRADVVFASRRLLIEHPRLQTIEPR